MAINTDAHSVTELGAIRYGVEQARRGGWLEKEDALNALSAAELERWLRRRTN